MPQRSKIAGLTISSRPRRRLEFALAAPNGKPTRSQLNRGGQNVAAGPALRGLPSDLSPHGPKRGTAMMMHQLFALSLGFAGLILATQATRAADITAVQGRQCGARTAIVETLHDTHGETRHGIGLAGNGTVVELYASAQTGSWTVVVTMANGMSCLLASGEGWEATMDMGSVIARGDPA